MIQSIGDIEFEMSEIQELGNGYCCAANRRESHQRGVVPPIRLHGTRTCNVT